MKQEKHDIKNQCEPTQKQIEEALYKLVLLVCRAYQNKIAKEVPQQKKENKDE